MKDKIRKVIKEAIAKRYPERQDIVFSVDYAPDNIDADFASNVALVLAKKLGQQPMETAERLRELISKSRNLDMSIAPPGFLNFKAAQETLLANLEEINKLPGTFGQTDIGQGKLAVVEYFQLNVAKPPHVGHLRSAVIGDCLKRILNFLGYKTVSDTHIGDWGTQIGIWISGLKKLPLNDRQLVIGDIQSSAKVYVEQAQQSEADPSLREQGKAEFVKLEQGDIENRQIWEQTVDTAKTELIRHAEALGLMSFDYHLGESFYQDKMPAVLQRLEQAGLLKVGETGEKYVDLEEFGLGRLICLKSDGATTYELRDLATLAYRYDALAKQEKVELALNLYVVDSRQAHDFRQVFKTMELLGYDISKSKHIEFGFMSLPEGPISTRKGTVISLEALIEEAKKRAIKIIEEKNPDLENKQEAASQVALGAIKYADLKNNRKSDIVFNWEEAFNFEGNTGPYLQYTHARLKSILRKAGRPLSPISPLTSLSPFHPHELTLLRKLLLYPDVITDAASEFLPNTLAGYLYDLASQVNSFYHEVPVLQAEKEEQKGFRLALVSACAAVLKSGLSLLGIEAPEEM